MPSMPYLSNSWTMAFINICKLLSFYIFDSVFFENIILFLQPVHNWKQWNWSAFNMGFTISTQPYLNLTNNYQIFYQSPSFEWHNTVWTCLSSRCLCLHLGFGYQWPHQYARIIISIIHHNCKYHKGKSWHNSHSFQCHWWVWIPLSKHHWKNSFIKI